MLGSARWPTEKEWERDYHLRTRIILSFKVVQTRARMHCNCSILKNQAKKKITAFFRLKINIVDSERLTRSFLRNVYHLAFQRTTLPRPNIFACKLQICIAVLAASFPLNCIFWITAQKCSVWKVVAFAPNILVD